MSLYPSSYSVGCQVSERGVASFCVEVVLDPVVSLPFEIGHCWPRSSVDQLFLVGREGRFRYGIVVTNTCPAQGTSDTILLAVPIEISGGVLRSAVGMEDHSRRRPAVGDSHIQSGRDELGAHMVGNGPSDQLAGIQVDHRHYVESGLSSPTGCRAV